MKKKQHKTIGIVVLSLITSMSIARSTDRALEVEVKAGRFLGEIDGVQQFTNGFNMTQGTLKIKAQNASIYRNSESGDIDRIELHGEPAFWQETLDNGSLMDATAKTMDYNLSQQTVLMSKDVVVNNGRDQVSGDQVRYDLKSQKIDAGSDNGGQITFRIKPKKTP